MKTAVIGNSHTLAIKGALSKPSRILGDVDFYFIPGAWEILERNNGKKNNTLLANSPKKEADPGISLADYDKFVIAACGWWAARNENIDSGNHPLAHMACASWQCESHRAPAGVSLVSEDVFRHAVEGWIRDQPVIQLATHISNCYQGQMILQPWPAPNVELITDANWVLNRWYGLKGPIAWFDYFKAQHMAIKALTKEMRGSPMLLEYPLPGPILNGFMAGDWCDPDPFHANEKYGDLIVKQVIDVLNS
jgi:hypothetical protein